MMAISLWEPWATLVVLGFKKLETRSWAWSYRGPLAIHAARHRSRDIDKLIRSEPFAGCLGDTPLSWGKVVGTVTKGECLVIRGDGLWSPQMAMPLPPEPELSFGDYRPGRKAWVLENALRFAVPFARPGRQGPFEVPDELIASALAASGRAA